jgi:hypothetical protein
VLCLTAGGRPFEAITEFVGRQARVGLCAARISAARNLFYLLSFSYSRRTEGSQ